MLMVYTHQVGLRRVYSGIAASLATCLLLIAAYPLSAVPARTYAASGCSASVDPTSAPDGSDTGFAFTVTDATDALAWVKVTSPSANLAIDAASSDWLPTVNFTSSFATFSGSAINPGNPIAVNVAATVSYFPDSNWIVQASTDSSGVGAMTCSGSLPITVTNVAPPNILTISATAAPTSAVVSWTTDKPANGSVAYGKTTAYGSQVSTATFDTGHNLTLSGLTPATTYHYQITCQDQSGNSVTSVDGTFFTAAQPTSTTTSSGQPAPQTPQVTNSSDKVPPTISFTTAIPKITAKEPTISGVAADNIAVTKVEYSTDGGTDWLSADTITGLGTQHASFSFTPVNLDDGTYAVLARATDAGGNITATPSVQLVIDRQPPVVGGVVIALGPQVLTPDGRGVITTIPNVNLSITTSTTGGATTLDIQAVNAYKPRSGIVASFAMHQVDDSSLWNGTLSFNQAGSYQLLAYAIDGAGNTTTRVVANVIVTSPGRTLTATGPIEHAAVTAYYLDPDTNNWTPWDGQPFGQQNPQTTDAHGFFTLFLPAGTYYLHAEAAGYQSVNSQTFTVSEPSAITNTLYLGSAPHLGPWQLPWLNLAVQVPVQSGVQRTLPPVFGNNILGSSLPNATFTDISGHTENTVEWLGKPTVVTVMSDWAPMSAEQVPILERLARNPDIQVKPIGLQASIERLRADNAVASSSLTWLADPDGSTLRVFPAGSVPAHYFVDRKGVVRQVVYGVLSYDQLVTDITNLP